MKNIFLKSGLILSTFLFSLSCNDLTELNIDPNQPTKAPAKNLVTQAEYELHYNVWGVTMNADWSLLLTQQWAQNEYAEESRYTVDGTDFNEFWEDMYSEVLQELETASEIIAEDEGLTEAEKNNQLGIIEILTAHTYHTLTDVFGDVPYAQALNSIDYPLPEYDSQQSIYTDILQKLETAVGKLNESAGSFGSSEIIYQGDIANWKKLGNSLMLRIAMRMADVDNATATQYVSKAAGNLISSNAENALFRFPDDATLGNPLYVNAVIDNRDDYAITDVLVDMLKELNDPRLPFYAKPIISDDNYVGMPYGLKDGDAFNLKSTTSRPNDMVRQATTPATIIDYSEVQFLLAEAYERGMLTGNAEDAFKMAVQASLEYWGASETDVMNYMDNLTYDATNWKQSIGEQKWLALYMNGLQSWAEWRRLDYPELTIPADATNSIIPVRAPYPQTEQSINGSSLGRVTSNPDDMNTKMWWDVN